MNIMKSINSNSNNGNNGNSGVLKYESIGYNGYVLE